MMGSWWGLWWQFRFCFLQHWGSCLSQVFGLEVAVVPLHFPVFQPGTPRPCLLGWQNHRAVAPQALSVLSLLQGWLQFSPVVWAPRARMVPRWSDALLLRRNSWENTEALFTNSPLPANKAGLFNKHSTNKTDLKLERLFHEWKLTMKINIFRDNRRNFS